MDEIVASTGTTENDDGEIDYARKSQICLLFIKLDINNFLLQ